MARLPIFMGFGKFKLPVFAISRMDERDSPVCSITCGNLKILVGILASCSLPKEHHCSLVDISMQINGWDVVPLMQKNTKKSWMIRKLLIMNETIFADTTKIYVNNGCKLLCIKKIC